jgi:DNA-binding phage protein
MAQTGESLEDTENVTSPEDLKAQAEAVGAVAQAREQRETANVCLRLRIVTAMRLGASPTDIAHAAGLTRSRVYQIFNEADTPDEPGA